MKHFISILMLFLHAISGYAQNDTIIESNQSINPSDQKYDRVYKLFIEEKDREIKQLWKLNFTDLMNIGYEHQLGKSFSSDTYLSWSDLLLNTRIDDKTHYLSTGAEQQFKYYYNLQRRQRLGKPTNGFSGNYFALAAAVGYNMEGSYEHSGKISELSYTLGLKYGLQRRIGNIGFYEFTLGVIYREFREFSSDGVDDIVNSWSLDGVHPVFNVKAGFAIDSFKNLKYMLK